jgi:citrate lyase subunit beta / citryl-CoA lyase
VIAEVYRPTPEEAAAARRIVAAYAEGEATGTGAVALPDGGFVDIAVVRQARAVLAEDDRFVNGGRHAASTVG